MERRVEFALRRWLAGQRRKPLVVRGARQVGKTTLVRRFAARADRALFEIDLEQNADLDRTFRTLDPVRIVSALEERAGRRLDGAILFLDEIQATPHALAALRYLFEQRPGIPVIAAGSLLEFTLASHSFAMPVGRIEYLHLGPMSFSEFLRAIEPDLAAHATDFDPSSPPGALTHERLVRRLREYFFVGGLPEAVLSYRRTGSMEEVARVHRSVAGTYADDFAKYARSADIGRLQRLFSAIARSVGEKVRYSRLDPDGRAEQTSRAIRQLVQARICHRVTHSHCSGLPLGASTVERTYKLVFLDVGLMNHLSGVTPETTRHAESVSLANKGRIAEQFIGQHLVAADGAEPPGAHYWLRNARIGNAEVDYVVSDGDRIVPVEVKAGPSGAMKSLRVFAAAKRPPLAVRFAMSRPSRETVHGVARIAGESIEVRFELLSLPLYAVESLFGVIADIRRTGGGRDAEPAPARANRPRPDRDPGRRGDRRTRPPEVASSLVGRIAASDSVSYTLHRWDEDAQSGRVEIGILSGGGAASEAKRRTLSVYPETARRFSQMLDSHGLLRREGERPSGRLARLDRSGKLLDFLETVSGEEPPDSEMGDLIRVLWEALQSGDE